MMRPPLHHADKTLLADCEIHLHRASGPGGQHRNKNQTAVRILHKPSRISASSADFRSQLANRKRAISRLKMKLATSLRNPPPLDGEPLPEVLTTSLLQNTKQNHTKKNNKFAIARSNQCFWEAAAIVLDMLDSAHGQLSTVATQMNISSSNLVSFFKSDRHLLAAAINIRRQHGLKPIR